MERILVRVPNWIGDAVMATAALRELRRLRTEAEITLWARPWVADLFRAQDLADQILTPSVSFLGVPAQLRGFDRAVLLQNAFSAAWTVWRSAIPERIGYRTDGRGPLLTRAVRPRSKAMGRHQVFYYLDLLHQTGLSPCDYLNAPDFQPDIRLRSPESGRRQALRLLEEAETNLDRRRVVLNPGAQYGSAKRWFPERYAELADRLIREMEVEVALVGSPGERLLAERIATLMRERPRILTGRTDLPSLMGVLAECDLMVTNDSGPMHLAAALDVPQIALFGSTDKVATGPLSDKAHVIHKHVACSPCLLRECPIDLRCFERIGVDEVFRQARQVLSRQSNAETSPHAAVFLDRDGTLIEEVEYLTDPNQIRILPGAVEAVAKLRSAGLRAVVVTNQSAVARGMMTEQALLEIHHELARRFQAAGAPLDAFYYCPHHPEFDREAPCSCRKPAPGLLLRAAEERAIDLRRSFMVGDRLRDVEAGRRAGCRTVLVETGYGAAEARLISKQRPGPDHRAANVRAAVDWILDR